MNNNIINTFNINLVQYTYDEIITHHTHHIIINNNATHNDLFMYEEIRRQCEEMRQTEEMIRRQREEIRQQREEMRRQQREEVNPNMYLSPGEELIEICSLCLDNVDNIESTSKLSCGHHFHTECISKCLERNILKCPLCRNQV